MSDFVTGRSQTVTILGNFFPAWNVEARITRSPLCDLHFSSHLTTQLHTYTIFSTKSATDGKIRGIFRPTNRGCGCPVRELQQRLDLGPQLCIGFVIVGECGGLLFVEWVWTVRRAQGGGGGWRWLRVGRRRAQARLFSLWAALGTSICGRFLSTGVVWTDSAGEVRRRAEVNYFHFAN